MELRNFVILLYIGDNLWVVFMFLRNEVLVEMWIFLLFKYFDRVWKFDLLVYFDIYVYVFKNIKKKFLWIFFMIYILGNFLLDYVVCVKVYIILFKYWKYLLKWIVIDWEIYFYIELNGDVCNILKWKCWKKN